jgi:20S proteasome subunit alpha 6
MFPRPLFLILLPELNATWCSIHVVQAAKTYLEKHFETFPNASLEDLVQHGLKALAATLSEGELTKQNVSVAIVGGGAPFVMLDDDDVEPYVSVSGLLVRLRKHTDENALGGSRGGCE